MPSLKQDLIPQINALSYIIQVPKLMRYHRNGRFIWGVTQFNNKDYTTLGHESYKDAQREGLYYCRWYEVMKWVTPDTSEPS